MQLHYNNNNIYSNNKPTIIAIVGFHEEGQNAKCQRMRRKKYETCNEGGVPRANSEWLREVVELRTTDRRARTIARTRRRYTLYCSSFFFYATQG